MKSRRCGAVLPCCPPSLRLAALGLATLWLVAQVALSFAGVPASPAFGLAGVSPPAQRPQTSLLDVAGQPAAAAAAAAAATWQPYPIDGGEITSIASDPGDPQVVYVGTRDAGVFKTTNGAQSWLPARAGLTYNPIRSLVVDPQHRQILYAGTDYNGIWKSTDGGATWADASSGLDKGLIVFSIVIDPQHTSTLYAGLAGGVGLVTGNIYKSTDGGASWTMRDQGIPRYSGSTYTNGVFTLAITDGNPALLYAGTNFDGAFRSGDGGTTWAAINGGLPLRSNSTLRKTVNALTVDPHHANRLSALISGDYYVYSSDSWQKVSQGSYSANGSLFTDHLYFHPTDPAIIYSAGDRFSVSTDGGVTWTKTLGWNTSGEIPAIAFHPTTPDTIYAASDVLMGFTGGVYKSTDRGDSWADASQGIAALAISSVAIDPQDTSNIYAGTGDASGGYLYRTQDGGVTWSRGYYTINPPPYEQQVYDFSAIKAIAVDPLDSQKLYMVATNFYTSTNQGERFYKVDTVEYPASIAIAAHASSPIYVGTSFKGIYKSADGGQTWAPKTQGLPTISGRPNAVRSLAIDPTSPDTVWAGTDFGGGVLKTVDGGEHWQVKGFTAYASLAVEAIAVHPQNSNIILVGASSGEGAIYKSTDGGSTWQPKIEGIAPVQQFVFDPRNPSWIYAAVEGYGSSGVLRSFDGGESWHDYSGEIFYAQVYSLAISAGDPPLLLAGSYGAGLYWSRPAAPERVWLSLLRQ